MKLKRLIIKNFRCLNGEENVIDFENTDIIFLIGKNNNGKSTFLYAYDFFVKARTKSSIDDFYNNDENIPIEIIGEFKVEEGDNKDKLLSKSDPDWINKWVGKDGLIKIKKVWSEVNVEGKKKTFNPESDKYEDGGFGGFDTLLTKYSPTPIFINAISTPEELEKQINDIITTNHIKKLEEQYKNQYDDIISRLKNLKNDISNAEDISTINEDMNKVFSEIFPKLELKIYSSPEAGIDITKTLKSTHGISVQDKHRDLKNGCDLRNNGHGVFRQAFFSFLSSIETISSKGKKEFIILFEEPELYLHPEAIFSLRSQLYYLSKNSPYQILCATHSPLMIDTSKPHSSLVRLVRNNDNKTRTYQVKFDMFEDDEKDYLQMINRFNPHICECFFADEVMLVEGDTEAIIYRDLIERYYDARKEVFVLNTGSKANMVFYQKILTHFGIKHIVVHDIDDQYIKDKNGKEKINSMWTFNERIWEQVITSNTICEGISRRYVHNKNFEDAHDYAYDKQKGKPLSAYLYARKITKQSQLPCIELLNDIYGNQTINHTKEYLEEVACSLDGGL